MGTNLYRNFMQPQLEPHILAVVNASNVACELVELLPDGDIAEELKAVLNIQHEILCEMIHGRHFGSASLDKFLRYLDETLENAENIRKCQ